MTKKIILSLFLLSLITISANADVKLEENTIDLNLNNTIQRSNNHSPMVLEFDSTLDSLPKVENLLDQKVQEKTEKIDQAIIQKTEEISNKIEEKVEEVSETVEKAQEDIQQKIEEKIDTTQNYADPNPDEVTDILEAIEASAKNSEEKIEENTQKLTESIEDTNKEIEKIQNATDAKVEEVKEVVEEVKKEIKEETTKVEPPQLTPIAPIQDLPEAKTVAPEAKAEEVTKIAQAVDNANSDEEITLDSIEVTSNNSSDDNFNIPKWEEFCESGYENATLKEKENILNIINFVDAERTKSNYWAERRANFEKSVNHCNSLEGSTRNYCFESLRKTETERNEIYEQQRKQVNYKNQGIQIHQ